MDELDAMDKAVLAMAERLVNTVCLTLEARARLYAQQGDLFEAQAASAQSYADGRRLENQGYTKPVDPE